MSLIFYLIVKIGKIRKENYNGSVDILICMNLSMD